MRLTRPLLLLALAALMAPRAAASRTSVWESNPPAAVLTSTSAAGLLAPLAPAGPLESIAAAVEPVEPLRFDLGDVVLVENLREDGFRIGLADVVEPPALRGPPLLDGDPHHAFELCDPENRIRGLDLLPPFRIGASPSLSLWPHQACGFSCREVASDSRYDPWGLSEQTMEMKEQACRVTGLGCPSVHDANAIWESQVVQGTVEAVGGAVQTGLGLMAWGSPEPLSKTAATIAIARGLDHMGAGWRSAWARKPVSALSDAVLEGAFGGYGTLVGVGVDLWSGGRSAWTTAEAPVPPPSVPPARPGATITLSYESGWNVRDFERKAEALQDLAERGKLRKAPNPVPRDPAVAAGFKNRLIRQAYAKYGKSDVARFQSLKKRILGMHADHVHELQLLGADDAANFTLLDGDVNMGIGRQIRAQIKGLDDYTPIIKVDVRGP